MRIKGKLSNLMRKLRGDVINLGDELEIEFSPEELAGQLPKEYSLYKDITERIFPQKECSCKGEWRRPNRQNNLCLYCGLPIPMQEMKQEEYIRLRKAHGLPIPERCSQCDNPNLKGIHTCTQYKPKPISQGKE